MGVSQNGGAKGPSGILYIYIYIYIHIYRDYEEIMEPLVGTLGILYRIWRMCFEKCPYKIANRTVSPTWWRGRDMEVVTVFASPNSKLFMFRLVSLPSCCGRNGKMDP